MTTADQLKAQRARISSMRKRVHEEAERERSQREAIFAKYMLLLDTLTSRFMRVLRLEEETLFGPTI